MATVSKRRRRGQSRPSTTAVLRNFGDVARLLRRQPLLPGLPLFLSVHQVRAIRKLWELAVRGDREPLVTVLRRILRRSGFPLNHPNADGTQGIIASRPDMQEAGDLVQLLAYLTSPHVSGEILDRLRWCSWCANVPFVARDRLAKYCSDTCESESDKARRAERARGRRARRAAQVLALGLNAPPKRCIDPRLLDPEGLRARVGILQRQGISKERAMWFASEEVARLEARLNPM